MKRAIRMAAAALGLAVVAGAADSPPGGRAIMANPCSPHGKLKTLDLADIRWTGGFWADRFDLVKKNTLPVISQALNDPRNGAQYASFLKVTGKGGEQPDTRHLNW